MHPSYDEPTFDNDIGALQLDAPVQFSKYIAPACLPFPRKFIQNI